VNRKELLALARERLDDTQLPPLVSDATLTDYYNRAIDEACLRQRGILDSTSKVCQFQVNANQRRYVLDPRIIKVGRARVGTTYQPLEPTTIRWLDKNVANWDTPGRTNIPQWYYCDQDRGASINMNLVPTPSLNDKCYLSVWRMPLDSEYLKNNDDCPPLPIFLHDGLVDWVEHLVKLRRLRTEQRRRRSRRTTFHRALWRTPERA